MAKFFGNGGEFASKGDKTSIPTGLQTNGNVSYETGYGNYYSASLLTDPNAKNVERQKFNQLLFDITEALGVLQNQGLWNWINNIQYSRGMQVLHNNDSWICVNANTNSEPNENNENWLRMVELFQQVGISSTYPVSNGTAVTAPVKGSRVMVTGYWKTSRLRVDYTARFGVAVNGIWKNMEKDGNRGGSKGHSYYSTFYFAFSHIYDINYNKGDTFTINVSQEEVVEYELMLTFLG